MAKSEKTSSDEGCIIFENPDGFVCHFWKGRKGSIPDTRWKVFTLKNEEFVEVGTVEVDGEFVRQEMIDHCSIKDYEPQDIAERLAHKKFPNANPIIVERIL